MGGANSRLPLFRRIALDNGLTAYWVAEYIFMASSILPSDEIGSFVAKYCDWN